MVEAILLGIAQDGGRPQAGCVKDCCKDISPFDEAYPVALGIVEHDTYHLIDVSRSLAQQLRFVNAQTIGHVFLTHAHFGHIDGLGLFGKETMNLRGIPLHLSASMLELMRSTPQWNLLLEQGVVEPRVFSDGQTIEVSSELRLQPLLVPHRAELSDTHAFLVRTNSKTLLYLPDHDTWKETLQEQDIRSWFASLSVDIALIDGTFWSLDELSHRVQAEVPHPPVSQTIEMLGTRQEGDPEIAFIHLNHTNPLYDTSSTAHKQVLRLGWDVGRQGMRYSLD